VREGPLGVATAFDLCVEIELVDGGARIPGIGQCIGQCEAQ
jgi:hypothetical protein